MTFKIGIENPKFDSNLGILFRSAYQLGADGVFTVGERYKKHPADTYDTCKQIPYTYYESIKELFNQGEHFIFVAVEQNGECLTKFVHPEKCIYLLGSESIGLSDEIRFICDRVVTIPSCRQNSYNVAVAGSIILYDRLMKEWK
jgi:tRNA G18 (ribose-2'-O)-methylase SpoU